MIQMSSIAMLLTMMYVHSRAWLWSFHIVGCVILLQQESSVVFVLSRKEYGLEIEEI